MLKKLTKQDKIIFLIIGIVLLAFTLNFIYPHYALDTYGMAVKGYKHYALKIYLVNGRPLMSLFLLFMGFINASYQVMHITSWSLATISLYFAIIIMYRLISRYSSKKVLNALLSFTMIVNVFCLEYFLFPDFSGIMCFGILIMSLATACLIDYFKTKEKNKYLWAIIFALIGSFTYQGLLACLVVFPLIFTFKESQNFKEFIVNNILIALIYGVSSIANMLFTLILGSSRVSSNFGLTKTIKAIFQGSKNLILSTGNIMPRYTYIIFIAIVIGIIIYSLIKTPRKKGLTIAFLIYMLLASIIVPLFPFLFADVWIVPRSVYVLGSLVAILGFFFLLYCNVNRKCINILTTIIILLIFFTYFGWLKFSHNRYIINWRDYNIVSKISQIMNEYEKNNNVKINAIKIYNDAAISYNYGYVEASGDMILSAFNSDWAAHFILDNYNNYDYKTAKDNKEIKNYCNTHNWNEFSHEQIIINNKNLYLCLY